MNAPARRDRPPPAPAGRTDPKSIPGVTTAAEIAAAGQAEPGPPRPIRARLSGVVEGCQVEVEAELEVRQLRGLVHRLKACGFEPTTPP